MYEIKIFQKMIFTNFLYAKNLLCVVRIVCGDTRSALLVLCTTQLVLMLALALRFKTDLFVKLIGIFQRIYYQMERGVRIMPAVIENKSEK